MKKFWIPIIIIIIIVVVFVFLKNRNKEKEKKPEYETVEVIRGDIEVKILSIGTIQPYTRVEIRSPVRGRIDSVKIDEGDTVKRGNIIAWISSEDRITLLDAARSALASAKRKKDNVAIEQAKRAYQVALKAYKPVPLITSISGEVIKRSCEQGQNVSLESVLFVLSDRLVARVEVDEADIGGIGIALPAVINLDAFPDEYMDAKVTKVSREGRMVSNVVIYDVMIEPETVPSHWASGMTATVTFYLEQNKDVLLIPIEAVKEMKGKKFVMVAGDEPKRKRIKTGTSDGKMIEVVEGLVEGETIILNFSEIKRSRKKNPSRMMRMLR